MLKDPLPQTGRKKRLVSKKARNLISGLLVGAACIFLVAYYLEVPTETLLRHFLATLLFVVVIMLLSVIGFVLLRLGRKLIDRFFERQFQDDSDRRDRE